MRSAQAQKSVSALGLAAQVGGALVGGVLVAVAGYYGVGLLLQGSGLGMGVLVLMVYAGVIGFGVGAGIGAALAGRWLGLQGSAALAVVGGVLGGGIVALIPRLVSTGLGLFETLFLAMAVGLVCAVGGYNLRRH